MIYGMKENQMERDLENQVETGIMHCRLGVLLLTKDFAIIPEVSKAPGHTGF